MNDYNSDIMVMGDNINFKETLKVRKIDEISKDVLEKVEGDYYHAIIFFDQSGENDINDDELLLIKKYVEEYEYNYIYIGTKCFDRFISLGFTTYFEEDEISFAYMGWGLSENSLGTNQYGNPYVLRGVWTKKQEEFLKERPEKLQEDIVLELVSNLKNPPTIYSKYRDFPIE